MVHIRETVPLPCVLKKDVDDGERADGVSTRVANSMIT